MLIEKDKVVSFYYTINEEGGEIAETNTDHDPVAYLHGHNNILPALEEAMTDKAAGDILQVTLPPEKAYGMRNENAVQKVPVKHLLSKHKRLQPGLIVKVNTEKGAKDATIIKAGKFMVTLDMNHPFAGKTLVFNLTIKDVRDATAEEIQHGHAHGIGGHHH